MGRLTPKMRPTEATLDDIPNQSGVYVLHRGQKSKYVGRAGAGRLRKRIEEQLQQKRGITTIQYRPTSSEGEARRLEERYRQRLNPRQKRI